MPMKAIDMEHHYFQKEVLDYAATRTEYPYYRDNEGLWCHEGSLLQISKTAVAFHPPTPAYDELIHLDEMRLKFMDEAGITTACVSSGGVIECLPREESIKYARMTNDAVAAACKKYPGRFLGTIVLPTRYVDDAIEELERAKKLGLKYWHTNSNYDGEYLFEEKFEPILAKCAELDIAFYIHPEYPTDDYLTCRGVTLSSAGFGFGVDVMRTAICLIMGGLFDRYPNLKMILGHMAETFPYTIDRMDNRFSVMAGLDPFVKMKHGFKYYFQNKNVMMTTSGIFDPLVLKFAIDEFGADSIMLGTDYPFEEFKGSVDFIKNAPISEEDKEKILYKNAEKYILKI